MTESTFKRLKEKGHECERDSIFTVKTKLPAGIFLTHTHIPTLPLPGLTCGCLTVFSQGLCVCKSTVLNFPFVRTLVWNRTHPEDLVTT